MNKTRFLSSVLVLCLFGMIDAFAAPTVKRLGANTARVGNNASVVTSKPSVSASVNNPQRLSSVRSKAVTGGVSTTSLNTVSPNRLSDVSSGDESRLSLGKYIYSSGVAKGTINTAPNVSSNDFINLVDRVVTLEGGMEAKQDVLTPGEGLILDNGVIELDEEYSQIPTQINDLKDEMDTKVSVADLEENYYSKDEVIDVLDEQIGTDINTVYDKASGERKYVQIVDTFNKQEFFNSVDSDQD